MKNRIFRRKFRIRDNCTEKNTMNWSNCTWNRRMNICALQKITAATREYVCLMKKERRSVFAILGMTETIVVLTHQLMVIGTKVKMLFYFKQIIFFIIWLSNSNASKTKQIFLLILIKIKILLSSFGFNWNSI